jgi:hypothetical protein
MNARLVNTIDFKKMGQKEKGAKLLASQYS